MINSIVIGNGTSRRGKDLQAIRNANILACNWFFKEEFIPDVLVASDEPISNYISINYPDYVKNNHFYTWFPRKNSFAKKSPTPKMFDSGSTATYIAASQLESNRIFLVGIDLSGIDGMINNLYTDKICYKRHDTPSPDCSDWIKNFEWIVNKYHEIQFYHVNPFNNQSPDALTCHDNFHQISYDEMMIKLKQ